MRSTSEPPALRRRPAIGGRGRPPAIEALEPRLLLDGMAQWPVVVAVTVNAGSGQRSSLTQVELTFSQDVGISAGAMSIWDYTRKVAHQPPADDFHYDAEGFAARWDLGDLQLQEGLYRVRLSSSLVQGPAALDGNADGLGGDDFFAVLHCLRADANGDAIVNIADLGILGASYGLSDRASPPTSTATALSMLPTWASLAPTTAGRLQPRTPSRRLFLPCRPRLRSTR